MPSEARVSLRLTWPRVHGAWSVLLCGYVLGVAAAGVPNVASLVLLCSVLAAFVGRHAAGLYLRLTKSDVRRPWVLLWAVAYALLSILGLAALVLGFGLSLLLVLAATGSLFALGSLVLESRRQDRTLVGELANIVGLSLVAPAAMYATSGAFDASTAGLWLLAAMFFAGRVLHVRYVLHAQQAGRADSRARLEGWVYLVYQLITLIVACAMSEFEMVAVWSPVVLAPAIVKAVWALRGRQSASFSVHRLGYNEVWLTLLFVLSLAVTWHIPGFRMPT